MISKVTVCPFIDTDHLVATAETAAEDHAETIDITMQEIKAQFPAIKEALNKLDNTYLAIITAVQNETIRNIVCIMCDHSTVCNKAKL